jgi:hypothetical protein
MFLKDNKGLFSLAALRKVKTKLLSFSGDIFIPELSF